MIRGPTQVALHEVAVVILVFLLYAGVFVAGLKRERELDAIMHEAGIPENPAISPPSLASMRECSGFWIPHLRGKVRSVFLVNAPVFMRGGAGFGAFGFTPRYVFFIVDVNGEAHELGRTRDEGEFEEDARWLARGLEVELVRRS
jgi:hypothetical protein